MSEFTVLGAGGFIGAAATQWLRARGHEVTAVRRNDLSAILAARPPAGHVLFCIGLTADFRERPLATADAHVGLVAQCLNSMDFESFLYLSSSRVYARSEIGREDLPIEVQPNASGDLYNITKLAGESLCLSDARGTVRVARLSNVYGKGMGSGNFLGQVLSEGISRGDVTLRQGSLSNKDYVALDDVLPALRAITTSGGSRLYNVARGISITHDQIATALRQLFGWRITAEESAAAIRFPRVDISRLSSEFATPRRLVLEDLAELVQAMRDEAMEETSLVGSPLSRSAAPC
jgi:nucleoside-diphosphate-sugar epimerase